MPWRKMRFFDKGWIRGDLDDDEFEKRIEDYGSYKVFLWRAKDALESFCRSKF